MMSRFDDALAQYDAALKLNPGYYQALNEIGRVQIGKYEAGVELDDSIRLAALIACRKSLNINPYQDSIRACIEQWQKPPH